MTGCLFVLFLFLFLGLGFPLIDYLARLMHDQRMHHNRLR